HLKRINAPKTWPITRKETVYTMRPRPSGHVMAAGITLNTLLKDELQMARTARGVRTILNTEEVLLNGKKQRRPDALAGLFDVVTFPAIKTSFRILINTKNTLYALPITGAETSIVPSKVTSKTLLAKGKQQIGFHNGLTLINKEKVAVGDTVLLSVENKIEKVVPFSKGAFIIVTAGKHVGTTGTVEKVENGTITVKGPDGEFTTKKAGAFVLGTGKSAIKIEA
ncbi:hypothetical protein GOV07_00600, partial [Candidatus Woesearchaeota archaeon]|nr:hypothetical protein [Candidatus Woesearchaeota archaeon]